MAVTNCLLSLAEQPDAGSSPGAPDHAGPAAPAGPRENGPAPARRGEAGDGLALWVQVQVSLTV